MRRVGAQGRDHRHPTGSSIREQLADMGLDPPAVTSCSDDELLATAERRCNEAFQTVALSERVCKRPSAMAAALGAEQVCAIRRLAAVQGACTEAFARLGEPLRIAA